MTAVPTIKEQVAEMHAARPSGAADGIMGAFGREQAALAEGGPPAGVAPLGVTLPDVELLDAHGASTTLY